MRHESPLDLTRLSSYELELYKEAHRQPTVGGKLLRGLAIAIVILGAPGFMLGWGFGRAAAENDMKALLTGTPRYDHNLQYEFDNYVRSAVAEGKARDTWLDRPYYEEDAQRFLGMKVEDIDEAHRAAMMNELMDDDFVKIQDRTVAQHTRAAFEMALEYHIAVIVVIALPIVWTIARRHRVWKHRYIDLYRKFTSYQMHMEQ